MKRSFLLLSALLVGLGMGVADASAQQPARGGGGGGGQRNTRAADMNTIVNPLPIADEVWLDKLTVVEVRDLIKNGNTNLIIMTGGIEANGPYVVTGKHNLVLTVMGESVARELGNTLVAPIITIEPGNPESAASPGGLRLSPETYMAVMRDMATSAKTQGFKNVIFFGDSGGNQSGMENVAKELNTKWAGSGAQAHYIREYYYEDQWSCDFIKNELKIFQQPDNCSATRDLYHDDVHYSSIISTLDPDLIRARERTAKNLYSINGVELGPISRTQEIGRRLVDFRTEVTVRAIKKAMAQ